MLEEVEIKIEYKDFLTPEQVAVFYDGLNQILSQYGVSDVKLNIKEGSLITKIKDLGTGMVSLLKKSYSNPETDIERKNAVKLTSALNKNNFSFFNFGNQTIYTSENISQEEKKMKQLNQDLENQQKETEEPVETLQMQITVVEKRKTEKNKKGTMKETDKISVLARFDDSRYPQYKEELKVIIPDDGFDDIDICNAHECRFIADGVLCKSNGKYTKFKITDLLKSPYSNIKLEQANLL